MPLNRGVFLDRDGTIVRDYPQDGLPNRGPRSLDEIECLPGVEEGCRLLSEAGLILCIVTNQADIARGLTTAKIQSDINWNIIARLGLDDDAICPHDDGDGCACRKPQPGLLIYEAVKFGLDLSRSYMIGDRQSDMLAAFDAGCKGLLVTPVRPFLDIVKEILCDAKT